MSWMSRKTVSTYVGGRGTLRVGRANDIVQAALTVGTANVGKEG